MIKECISFTAKFVFATFRDLWICNPRSYVEHAQGPSHLFTLCFPLTMASQIEHLRLVLLTPSSIFLLIFPTDLYPMYPLTIILIIHNSGNSCVSCKLTNQRIDIFVFCHLYTKIICICRNRELPALIPVERHWSLTRG